MTQTAGGGGEGGYVLQSRNGRVMVRRCAGQRDVEHSANGNPIPAIHAAVNEKMANRRASGFKAANYVAFFIILPLTRSNFPREPEHV